MSGHGSKTISSALDIITYNGLPVTVSVNNGTTTTTLQSYCYNNCIRVYLNTDKIESPYRYYTTTGDHPEFTNNGLALTKMEYVDIVITGPKSITLNYNITSTKTYTISNIIYPKTPNTLTLDYAQYIVDIIGDKEVVSPLESISAANYFLFTFKGNDYIIYSASAKTYIYNIVLNKVQEFSGSITRKDILNMGTCLLMYSNKTIYYTFNMSTWKTFTLTYSLTGLWRDYASVSLTAGSSQNFIVSVSTSSKIGYDRSCTYMPLGNLNINDSKNTASISLHSITSLMSGCEWAECYDPSYNGTDLIGYAMSYQGGTEDMYIQVYVITPGYNQGSREHIYIDEFQWNDSMGSCCNFMHICHDPITEKSWGLLNYMRNSDTDTGKIYIIPLDPNYTEGSHYDLTELSVSLDLYYYGFNAISYNNIVMGVQQNLSSGTTSYLYGGSLSSGTSGTIKFIENGPHSLPMYFDNRYFIFDNTGIIREYSFNPKPTLVSGYYTSGETLYAHSTPALQVNGKLIIGGKSGAYILEKGQAVTAFTKKTYPSPLSGYPKIYYSHGIYVFQSGKVMHYTRDFNTWYTLNTESTAYPICLNGLWLIGGKLYPNLLNTTTYLSEDFTNNLKEVT